MNRLLGRILAFGLLTTALAGVFLFLLAQQRPIREDSLQFSQREPTQIARIDVSNAEGSYAISYDSLEGGYVIGDVPAELADMDRFIQFMMNAANLGAEAAIQGAGRLDDYGLEKPQAQITVSFDDGQSLRFDLGDQEKVSGNYYLALEGRDGVYLYGKAAAEAFLADQSYFVSRQVTPPLQVSSPLSAIRDAEFSGKQLDETIRIQAVMGANDEIRKDALSFGAATHLVRGRATHELDQAGGIRVLGSLLGIQAIKVEGYNLGDDELRSYGFDDPDMQVSFVLGDRALADPRIELKLVRAGDDSFYAMVGGRNVVYLINRPAFYDLRYEDLIMRYFISPMLVDVKGLSIRTPEESYEVSYDRTPEREEIITLNGKPIASEAFHAFYRLVTSAAADGELVRAEAPQNEASLEIIYRYKTEQKPDDVLRFYPGSPRRMLVQVNDVIELDIRESFVTRLIAACQSLASGTAIEENW